MTKATFDGEEHAPTVREQIAEYTNDCDAALHSFHKRSHWEAATEETALDSVVYSESVSLDRLSDEQLRAELEKYGVTDLATKLCREDQVKILCALNDTEYTTRRETVTRQFQFFCADGIHPASVLRRVYALGAHMAISPFCDLNLRERGLMLGESHGAQHWRTQRICVDPLRRRGDRAWKAPGQKSLESRETYARVAEGNQNRKKKKNK